MPTRAKSHRPYIPGARIHEKPEPSRQKRRALHTGSKAWRLIRERVLAEELYRCRQCGQYGDQVDHVNGDPGNNDRSNLAVMCRACHSIKTAKEDGGFGNRRGSAR